MASRLGLQASLSLTGGREAFLLRENRKYALLTVAEEEEHEGEDEHASIMRMAEKDCDVRAVVLPL